VTDLALLQRWTDRRDAQAFKQIVSRYASMVYATCIRILHNSAEAEDVTQECFESLALGPRRPTEHLGPWLHRVATNRALDRIRSEQRRKTREAGFVAELPSRVEPAWDDVYSCVDEVLAELPEEVRIPVVAHYLLGESHAEIAASTGVPRRTVSHRITHGVDLIGESLKKRGIHVASGALATLLAANMAQASALPPTLTAALGKLALAQSVNTVGAATVPVATAASVGKLIGGMLIMKKFAAVVVVVIGALLAYWALKPQASEPNIQPQQLVQNKVQKSAVPQPAGGNAGASQTGEAASAQPGPAAGVPEPVTPGISGRVVDAETGQPVPGAEVVAQETMADYAKSGQRVEALSDDNGRFQITGLQPGFYLVMKKAGPDDYMGSLPDDMAEVRLRDGEQKEGLLLIARKGGTVSGTITNERGSPLAGASVELGSARNESFQGIKAVFSRIYGSTETDASGQYTFRGVNFGKSCTITATAAGYTPALSPEFSLVAPGASKRVDLRLGRGSAISGWVVDRAAEYQPGIELTLEPDFEGRSHVDTVVLMGIGRTISGMKSDENGMFRIDGLPAGAYHLFAGGITRSLYNNFEGGGTRVEVDGVNEVDGVTVRAFSLGRGDHWIAGHVSDPEGAPVAGAEVDVLATQPPVDHFVVHTDETGAFLIDGLLPTDFMLVFTASGYAQALVNSPPLDTSDLAVTLRPNVPVRGRVLEREGGRPVPAAKISVAQHDRSQRSFSSGFSWLAERFDAIREDVAGRETTNTAADGTFELSGVEPGTILLKAERLAYAAAYSDKLVIEAGQPVEDVTIYMSRGATVEGSVRTVDGAPVEAASILVAESRLPGEEQANAEVRLLRVTNMGQGSRDIRAISDANGRFTVDGLADGQYWMRALATGYAPSPVATLSISDAAAQSGLELVLDPGGTIEGRCTQGGMPKPDVIVQATRDGLDADAIRVYSNADGYYIIEHVMPGEHEIRAVDFNLPGNTGLQTAQVEVVSGKTIRQDFEYTGHILRGTVTGLANPVEWQVAILNISDGIDPEAPPDMSIDWISLVAATTPINADGTYIIGNLADGVYKLEVFQLQNDGIVPKGVWQTIEINGEDLDVDIQTTQ